MSGRGLPAIPDHGQSGVTCSKYLALKNKLLVYSTSLYFFKTQHEYFHSVDLRKHFATELAHYHGTVCPHMLIVIPAPAEIPGESSAYPTYWTCKSGEVKDRRHSERAD